MRACTSTRRNFGARERPATATPARACSTRTPTWTWPCRWPAPPVGARGDAPERLAAPAVLDRLADLRGHRRHLGLHLREVPPAHDDGPEGLRGDHRGVPAMLLEERHLPEEVAGPELGDHLVAAPDL